MGLIKRQDEFGVTLTSKGVFRKAGPDTVMVVYLAVYDRMQGVAWRMEWLRAGRR